jgi:hypothetical protein
MGRGRNLRTRSIDIASVTDVARIVGNKKVCDECDTCKGRGRLAELSRTIPTIMDLLAGYTNEAIVLIHKVEQADQHDIRL